MKKKERDREEGKEVTRGEARKGERWRKGRGRGGEGVGGLTIEQLISQNYSLQEIAHSLSHIRFLSLN